MNTALKEWLSDRRQFKGFERIKSSFQSTINNFKEDPWFGNQIRLSRLLKAVKYLEERASR